MRVYNSTLDQLEQAVAATPCKLFNVQYGTNYIQFVIRPTDDTPQSLRKVGFRGRKVWALSYEGHRCFMDNLFTINPQVKLTSSGYDLTYNHRTTFVYDGKQSYEAQVGPIHHGISAPIIGG